VYVLFNLIVPLMVLAGAALRWDWIRNSTFRNLHIVTLGIPVVEAAIGIPCPLITQELELRAKEPLATPTWSQQAFDWIVYTNLDPTIWRIGCVLFGILTVVLYIWIPPRWPGRLWSRSSG
jgi:hypothetical protein